VTIQEKVSKKYIHGAVHNIRQKWKYELMK